MMMKKQKSTMDHNSHFDLLSEEIIFQILDFLNDSSSDRKSFSLVCKSFYTIESHHRRSLRPHRSEHLNNILTRYPYVTNLDLSLCPRITDGSLSVISTVCSEMLRKIDLSRSKFFTQAGLTVLVTKCPNLVEIDLSNATELKDSAAVAIAEAKNLEILRLARCKSITDIGIGCIAVGCKKLKLINLKWCLGIGDLGISLLAVKCKEIRSLDLSHLPITNNSLEAVLKLQYLEDLVLYGCFGIYDDCLSVNKQQCKSLKMLDMSSCPNISHVGLLSLTNGTGCIEQLILASGSPVTLGLANSLQKLSALKSIKLDWCIITCSGLDAIGNCCTSLREISLSKCSGVTDEGLSSLVKKCKDLEKLDITCCRKITYVSIANITNSCSSLTSLKMEACTLVPREAFVLIGEYCHLLEELDITDNEIGDEGLKSISRCSKLVTLKLGLCLNITDQGLVHIGKGCTKLVELDLYRSAGVKDTGLLSIARGCTNLETINMSYCKDITDSSLISLSKCSKLNTLEIRGCSFITSTGLAAIAMGCRNLTKLDIKKCCSIDDAGMITLAHFSQYLRLINLSYSSVTDIGLLSLASISCLQSLTILHWKGLSANGLATALLACGGLTKVKLHTSFKSLLSQLLFDHLEARGCVFHWRDKEYQDELDPQCWKLKAEDMQ
ncbi:F-box/LRR-repeat protein 3-like [Impatiens glandulifera]|uniref:F-box/LRR-repeat protein 3-like n=1 Tax=Impatiens glandulifera TaxID=253017 RepID=UPI001FB05030|nr:F-box/LRR-repeat protein 3-like [Impatiens glandulifera]